jgi:hypothetical protein
LLVDLNGVDVFLTKSAHWAYECEWRVLEPLAGATKVIPSEGYPIHLFEYPVSALVEVILGARAGERTKAEVVECLQQPELRHVILRHATFDDRDFALRLVELAI